MLFISVGIDLLLGYYLFVCRRGEENKIMVLLFIIYIFIFPAQILGGNQSTIVNTPFYLRVRIHDSHSASVLFEIPRKEDHRICEMYKFTIRHNNENPYSMPEQNLTYWRNSLELTHLAAGHYNVCAIICSEQLPRLKSHYQQYLNKNRTIPVTTCVAFDAVRSHLLILTLYILVFIILIFSQVIYSLRKRQIQARIKLALIEVENSLQKWRSNTETLNDHSQSCAILQSLVTLPASPVEHSTTQIQSSDDEQHPIIFHLDYSTDHP